MAPLLIISISGPRQSFATYADSRARELLQAAAHDDTPLFCRLLRQYRPKTLLDFRTAARGATTSSYRASFRVSYRFCFFRRLIAAAFHFLFHSSSRRQFHAANVSGALIVTPVAYHCQITRIAFFRGGKSRISLLLLAIARWRYATELRDELRLRDKHGRGPHESRQHACLLLPPLFLSCRAYYSFRRRRRRHRASISFCSIFTSSAAFYECADMRYAATAAAAAAANNN